MNNNNNINKFTEFVTLAGAPAQARVGGRYTDRLDADELDLVARFGEWLKAEGMTDASVASYRSYVAQAMCAAKDGIAFSELSSSVRSALRKLARFTGGAASAS